MKIEKQGRQKIGVLVRPTLLQSFMILIKRMIGKSARLLFRLLKKVKALFLQKKQSRITHPYNWPPKGANKPFGKPVSISNTNNRILFYHFYDSAGVVDRYVLHFLKAISPFVSRIVFISNGALSEKSELEVRKFTESLIIRDNSGFDAWGMKEGIESIGSEVLEQYDEILLLNSTFFGPVHDLSDLFETMSKKDVDFWGITNHPGYNFDPFGCNPYGYIPPHVQSYWLAIRKRMFSSDAFWMFWKNLPKISDYNQAVGFYETTFTKYFSDLGFEWSTWVKGSDYEALTDNPLIATPVESIRDMKVPIVKWRAFFQDYDYLTTYTGQHTASCLMDYIQNELDYPIENVWKYLIRTRHMSDLTRNLHLAEILSKTRINDTNHSLDKNSNSKVALFMHIFDDSMAKKMAEYASNMPIDSDIWISTTDENKKKNINRVFGSLNRSVTVRVCPNRGRDVSALLASFKDVVMNYDIICVTHDKKTSHLFPETVGEGFAYMGYENILASEEYVLNILHAFELKPFLGMLYTPSPNHADFATQIGTEWGANYNNCKNLAKELRLLTPMDEEHRPCAPFGSNFWIRTKALKPLYNKDWSYSDFPEEPLRELDGTIMHAIERIYPYCVQDAGFYSSLVMTDEYSSIELGNLEHYAQTFADVCFKSGIENRYITVRDTLDARLGSGFLEENQSVSNINRTTLIYRIKNKLSKWASL